MKISFSTLGCPDWSWEDMLSTAKDIGFDGIEIRGIGNELYAPKAKQFTVDNIDLTKKKLDKIGIEIPCLTSASYLFDKTNIDKNIREAQDYIELAARLGTPYVRVLGDAQPQAGEVDIDFVIENLKKLSGAAKEKGVKLLLETNGVFAASKVMKAAMEKVNSESVGVLWDVHHPYRFFDESVEETFENLKDYICFIHIKDSLVVDGVIKYKMMGHGDVPIKNIIRLMKENDYKGYLSLEWVKRWCLDLEEPGIVFAHYAGYMKSMI
ncbi:MAG: sugar phosphate isomerase/epimerase [Eubacterium sp.]|jgi:fatty-acyl-CoA synthase|nr:sugar phosphate isomerase/epimerase [Eubacterium sp.]